MAMKETFNSLRAYFIAGAILSISFATLVIVKTDVTGFQMLVFLLQTALDLLLLFSGAFLRTLLLGAPSFVQRLIVARVLFAGVVAICNGLYFPQEFTKQLGRFWFAALIGRYLWKNTNRIGEEELNKEINGALPVSSLTPAKTSWTPTILFTVSLLGIFIWDQVNVQKTAHTDTFFNSIRAGDVVTVANELKSAPELIRATSGKSNLSPLHVAAINGQDKVTEVLLANGADVNAKDDLGNSALHWAARSGSVATVKILISKGASINAVAAEDFTPLHLAVIEHKSDVVALLIENGANPNAGILSPIKLAEMAGDSSMLQLLHSKDKVK